MITCLTCGADNKPDSLFCMSCGAKLVTTASTTSTPLAAEDSPPIQSDAPPVVIPHPVAPAPPPPPAPYPTYPPPPPGYGSQPGYLPPPYPYVQRPPKDRSIALILEILPNLFGFFGFGWIYAGNIAVGIIWLVSVFVWDLIVVTAAAITASLACICLVPTHIVLIAISAYSLNEYTKKHPELFGP